MEWQFVEIIIALVGFVGGFVAGSWKLSGMFATMQEKLASIEKSVNSLISISNKVQDHEYRIIFIEQTIKDLKVLINDHINDSDKK